MNTIFFAKMDELRAMLRWIHDRLHPMEFDSPTLRKVELASEEALVNIIQHAYCDRSGKIEIEVRAFPKSHVEIAIKDQGPPFNPLTRKEVDRAAPLEEREVGGLGIYFMRQNMDEVRYLREGDTNVLVLVKKTH